MRQLPRVLVATFVVVACPAAAVLALGSTGLVASPIALSLIAVPLSVAVSWLGAAAWKRRAASGDLLFGDLMLWGWLRRWRFERLFSHTAALVGSNGDVTTAPSLSRERRARLLERLSRALEARDPRTHGHSRRVARHAAAIARRMSLPRQEVARIRTAAVLHDVGKIDTPKEIIDKPGPLTAAEYEVVKRHASVGARMVAALGDARLTALVRNHHERMDGGGYPDGLAGEAIPLGARIIAVADTFDAVTSARPYRQAMAHREALALLGAEAGTQLDPEAVRGFRRYYSGFRPIALWAAMLSLPRQAGFLLLDLPRFGSALTSAKVAAASLATVAVGTAIVHPGVPANRPEAPASESAARVGAQRQGTVVSSPASGPSADGKGNGGKSTPVEVSSPGAVATPAAEDVSGPSGSAPSGSGSNGGETDSATATPGTPESPAGSGGGSGSQAPTTPVTTPVETTAPPVKPVTSAVNQTVEGVGSTVNQVVTPTVESVNGIIGQATGGILGGGK